MSDCEGRGTLVVSIDLELDPENNAAPQQRRLDIVRSRLVEITRDAGLPATWAVADPMLSAASESILSANCGHEIAVLGDRAWLGPGCGRERLGRELARRFTAPRKSGIAVSTLILRNVAEVVDREAITAHGVTAISGPAVDRTTGKAIQPPIIFGLWQPPIAWRAPLRAAWGLPAGWQARRAIKRAGRAGTLLHLRLDAAQLVTAPDLLDMVAVIVRYAAAKRDANQLAVTTIAQLASQALISRCAHPSRSILRPAA
jgi:hypothetical protein